MRPAYQTVFMCILAFLLLIHAGCGRKHLHVSTMSGAPGEEEVAMGPETSEDQTGLDSSELDESGLKSQEASAEESSADDLEPLDFTHTPTPPLSQEATPPPNTANNDVFAGLNDDAEGNQGNQEVVEPRQEIQSQSPSLPPLLPLDEGAGQAGLDKPLDTNGNPNLPNLDLSDQLSGDTDAPSDNLPPLVAFNTPEESTSNNPFDISGQNEESPLPVEQIPGNIAVAKAEPSDAFREQLEKIEAEEHATRAAGLNDVFFEFDSWALTAEGRQTLEEGAEWLNQKSSAKLLIEGHCDSRGTQAYNLVLGKKRAAAMRDYLVELGITEERVAIISYGQDKPFCSDPTEVCYQLNRRGHVLVQNQ